MRARLAALPTRTLIGLAVGVVLVYALVVWFLLVTPKRAEATALEDDVVAAELRLADAQLAASRPTQVGGSSVGQVLRLAKAMPSSSDQTGLVLELELLGRAAGVEIGSIAPGEPTTEVGGPVSIPVVVTMEGSYRQITRFLSRVRGLVAFRGGKVDAKGRLFTVHRVDLTESVAEGFPRLDAAVTLNAFVYDGPLVEETPLPGGATDDDVSTDATAARSTS